MAPAQRVLEHGKPFVDHVQWPHYEHHIVSYLLRHPEAQDTIEGITEWWLLEERIQFVSEEVTRAVVGLMQRGYLVAVRHGDGRVIFQLNREKAEEVREWLERARRPEARIRRTNRRLRRRCRG